MDYVTDTLTYIVYIILHLKPIPFQRSFLNFIVGKNKLCTWAGCFQRILTELKAYLTNIHLCWQFTVNLDYQRSAVTMVTDCRWLSQGLLSIWSSKWRWSKKKKSFLLSRCDTDSGEKTPFCLYGNIWIWVNAHNKIYP